MQRLAFSLIKRRLSGKESLPKEKDAPKTTAERVLDLARWAPSGDNLQPWRFTLQGEREFLVAPDNRTRDVYFLNDGPKLLALGGLLETISVAATVEKCNAVIEREPSNADTASERIYRVRLEGTTDVDPLAPFIKMRATNRRSLSRAPLSQADREALESAAAPFHVLWLESDSARRKMSRMISRYTKIRLSIPEAFETHQKVIAWNSRYSADRIPDQAIGLDPVTLKLMRWAMKKWSRVRWMNRYLAGTWMPRLQLDLIPGRHCAAFVALLSPQPIMESDDFIAAGRAMQRFWLTLTRLGLQCQPQLAPLIFDSYVRDKIAFTADVKMLEAASALSPQLRSLLGEEDSQRAAFLCRVGFGQTARSRSLRKPLSQFLWPEKEG